MDNLTGWYKIAREIGDYTCVVYCHGEAVDECRAEMEPIPEYLKEGHVGQWLPAEAASKEILRLREALAKIAAQTYGSDITDTDKERADHYWSHIQRMQWIAREALTTKDSKDKTDG